MGIANNGDTDDAFRDATGKTIVKTEDSEVYRSGELRKSIYTD